MIIKFLGTGAADWKFGLSEEEISGFYRRATSHIIDGKILVDISPQSFDYAEKQGIDLSEISHVIISHTHADHYSKRALLSFAEKSKRKLSVFCDAGAIERLGLAEDEANRFDICAVAPAKAFRVGEYSVTALAANHLVKDSAETPLHYIIEKDGRCLFYGLDGGWFTAQAWEFMRLGGFKFDGMILDSTVGESDSDFRLGTHNSLPMLRIILASLRANGMTDQSSVIIASHLAKTLHRTDFCEVKAQFEEMGMTVACDGDAFEI